MTEPTASQLMEIARAFLDSLQEGLRRGGYDPDWGDIAVLVFRDSSQAGIASSGDTVDTCTALKNAALAMETYIQRARHGDA